MDIIELNEENKENNKLVDDDDFIKDQKKTEIIDLAEEKVSRIKIRIRFQIMGII